MPTEIAFDTHRFVKNLTASGFTVAQAEALAHEQIHLLEANLATKSDLAAVKSDLEVRIEKVRADLARWMLTGWVAQTGVLATLIWYFSSGMPGG
ncbi:MAG: DUF1640 domain-containing protein [Proteobacteria bacterium]|nr:DUF1640 domain-containing protein [Pseudomonadota bacterium]MYJ94118.1 DUF1640 domain-containing protein [Pseudomonadota bacterium]